MAVWQPTSVSSAELVSAAVTGAFSRGSIMSAEFVVVPEIRTYHQLSESEIWPITTCRVAAVAVVAERGCASSLQTICLNFHLNGNQVPDLAVACTLAVRSRASLRYLS